MSETVTPPETPEPSLGERALDAVFGLGALVLLLPALPIIFLVWLYSKLRGPSDGKLSWNRERA